jgi:hypothetical protein
MIPTTTSEVSKKNTLSRTDGAKPGNRYLQQHHTTSERAEGDRNEETCPDGVYQWFDSGQMKRRGSVL